MNLKKLTPEKKNTGLKSIYHGYNQGPIQVFINRSEVKILIAYIVKEGQFA